MARCKPWPRPYRGQRTAPGRAAGQTRAQPGTLRAPRQPLTRTLRQPACRAAVPLLLRVARPAELPRWAACRLQYQLGLPSKSHQCWAAYSRTPPPCRASRQPRQLPCRARRCRPAHRRRLHQHLVCKTLAVQRKVAAYRRSLQRPVSHCLICRDVTDFTAGDLALALCAGPGSAGALPAGARSTARATASSAAVAPDAAPPTGSSRPGGYAVPSMSLQRWSPVPGGLPVCIAFAHQLAVCAGHMNAGAATSGDFSTGRRLLRV